jgi:hypothetical protein
MILQAVQGFRDRRFTRDEPAGHRAEDSLGPRVIDVASIDGGLKRSGVDDDGSSR